MDSNIKLNEWITEEIDVPAFTPKLNEEKGRVEFSQTKIKATQKTFYASSTPVKVICSNHTYIPINLGRYHFRCTKCAWNKIAPPDKFKYDPVTKKLFSRSTDSQV